ncbi:MAG: carboxymuconolactone decarboxylase family protein [Chloroflexi bacterium]|nr:carboxymuconolactone decarboxylase family protein [Chloroflexota bacterium]
MAEPRRRPGAEDPTTIPPADERAARLYAHFRQSLHVDPLPEFWARLIQARPEVMEGYVALREPTMRDVAAGGAVPKKVKELAIVAENIVRVNPFGVTAHTKAAVRAGATLDELWEVMALVIAESGMILYKMAGYDAIIAAEEALAELAQERARQESAR